MRHVRMLGLCLVAVFAVSAMAAANALAAEAPTVAKLEPNNGPTTGDQSIFIKGTGFPKIVINPETNQKEVAPVFVKFGTGEAISAEVVVSETELRVEIPAHEVGEVEVAIQDENGTSSGVPKFSYRPKEVANNHWQKLVNCPLHGAFEGHPVIHCVAAQSAPKFGGFYTVGGITVPVTRPIKLQSGSTEEEYNPEHDENTEIMAALIAPEDGALDVVPVAEPVPVAVLNNVSEAEMNEFNWPKNLRASYKTAQGHGLFEAGKTSEVIEPAGKDQNWLSPFNLLVEEHTGLLAHVQITGKNPWLDKLGGYCQIGSEAEPVVQHLRTGPTESPLTHEVMRGKPGFAELSHNFELAALVEDEIVDNTYSVPAATKCGGQIWEKYLDPVVNKAFGLPAPAGASETRLEGAQYTATAKSTEAGLLQETIH